MDGGGGGAWGVAVIDTKTVDGNLSMDYELDICIKFPESDHCTVAVEVSVHVLRKYP